MTELTLYALMDCMLVGVFINQRTKILYTNPAFQQMIGYTEEELLEIPLTDLICDEFKQIVLQRAESRLIEENIKLIDHYEFDMVHKDGYIINIEFFVSKIHYHSELATIATLIDVTEKKRVIELLRQSEEKYRSVVEKSHMGIAVINDNSEYTFANEEFFRITGYKPSEIIGKHFDNSITDQYKPFIRDLYTRRQKGEDVPNNYNIEFIRSDDEIRTVQIRSAIFRDSLNKVNTLVQVLDVTDHQKVEEERRDMLEAIQKSELKYRALFESSGDALLVMDYDKILDCNKKSLDLFECSRFDIIGSTPFDFSPEKQGNNLKSTDYGSEKLDLVVDGIPQVFEWKHRSKKGKEFDAEINLSKIGIGDEELVQAVVRDLTARKNLEAQLMHAQKMEAIGTLAGGIAHDFNNLLMGIQGYVSLMLMDLNQDNASYKKLQTISEIVGRGTKLTKQLLGFARGGRYDVKSTRLASIIDNAIVLFGQTYKAVTIHKDVNDDINPVLVDSGQIDQVIVNLFINSIQANAKNIYVKIQNVNLDTQFCKMYQIKTGEYVKLSVIDDGIGMSEEIQSRVFEPFFSTKEVGKGTGLGLASAYGIIRNHEGIITVSSKVGQGATFEIYLPARDKSTDIKIENTASVDIVRGCENILIVDDEQVVRDVLYSMLKSLGYTVFSAGSGKTALELYSKYHDTIDLIIIDLTMPEMDGFKVFEKVREINDNVRVLICTGHSINGAASILSDRGRGGFLQKPFTRSDLSKKLRLLLDKKEK